MTNQPDFDPIARAFMASGPTQLADRVLERSLAEVHRKRQRRVLLWAPWRTPVMNIYAKLAAAAVVVVAVGALGVWFLSPGSSPSVGAPPAESAPPSASPEPGSTPEPSLTPSPVETIEPLSETFTSSVHGISLATPEGWTAQPATEEAWNGAAFPNYEDPSVDLIFDPVHQGELWLMVASVAGADPDEWPAGQLAELGCVTVQVTVDGVSGLIGAEFDRTDCSAAFVIAGGRGYMIRFYDSTGGPGYDRAWFDEVLASVDLRPEDAID